MPFEELLENRMVYHSTFGTPVLTYMHFSERVWRSSEQEY